MAADFPRKRLEIAECSPSNNQQVLTSAQIPVGSLATRVRAVQRQETRARDYSAKKCGPRANHPGIPVFPQDCRFATLD